MPSKRIAFVAADTEPAQGALALLRARYASVEPDQAEIVVALGGDGFMLETLHRFNARRVPIYGMHRGTVGFLMNDYREDGLEQRLEKSTATTLYPLRMEAQTVDGKTHTALAINEVSLLRETRFAAKVRITVDGVLRMDELICDGVLLSTPAGSTAYNLSAHGPILPVGSNALALTPISAFRPRRWRGAILSHAAKVVFEVKDARHRPVSATADFTEIRDVTRVEVREDRASAHTILFDAEHNFEERILKEQFIS